MELLREEMSAEMALFSQLALSSGREATSKQPQAADEVLSPRAAAAAVVTAKHEAQADRSDEADMAGVPTTEAATTTSPTAGARDAAVIVVTEALEAPDHRGAAPQAAGAAALATGAAATLATVGGREISSGSGDDDPRQHHASERTAITVHPLSEALSASRAEEQLAAARSRLELVETIKDALEQQLVRHGDRAATDADAAS